MSLKHKFNKKDLCDWNSLALKAFKAVAEEKHYKAVVNLQMNKTLTLESSIRTLLDNKEFEEKCLNYINGDDVYSEAIELIVEKHHSFEQFKVPTREADFMVNLSESEEVTHCIYFFIKEGVELQVENTSFMMSRILIDHFTDALLYNDGDGWQEYKYEKLNPKFVSSLVAIAFRDYLAEKELLGEDDE